MSNSWINYLCTFGLINTHQNNITHWWLWYGSLQVCINWLPIVKWYIVAKFSLWALIDTYILYVYSLWWISSMATLCSYLPNRNQGFFVRNTSKKKGNNYKLIVLKVCVCTHMYTHILVHFFICLTTMLSARSCRQFLSDDHALCGSCRQILSDDHALCGSSRQTFSDDHALCGSCRQFYYCRYCDN